VRGRTKPLQIYELLDTGSRAINVETENGAEFVNAEA